MQIVKNFIYGRDWSGYTNAMPLEDQINEYLKYHPGYSVATMSLLNASGYKEALVVFNTQGVGLEKDIKRSNKQNFTSISSKDYMNQNKITTAHNNEKS